MQDILKKVAIQSQQFAFKTFFHSIIRNAKKIQSKTKIRLLFDFSIVWIRENKLKETQKNIFWLIGISSGLF